MVNFKTQQDFIEFQIQQLNFEPNISIVTSIDFLEEILEGMDFDYEYSKNINSDNFTYVIDKNENEETGEIFLFVEPLIYDGEGCLETTIENEIVIVQKYLLDEDDFEGIWCDEIIVIDYDEEESSDLDNDETENTDLISTKLEFVEEVLENFGTISFVTDYETALELNLEYGIHEYDYVGIDLQSDNYLYLVDIIPNECFVIEPLTRQGEYYHIECEELIIDGEIEDEIEEEFFNFVCAEEINVVRFIDENECCPSECEDNEISEEVSGLIDCVLEDIENGACPKCSLINLYRIAYEDGQEN